MAQFETVPAENTYDVVIIGGAIMGASVAWFLAANPVFNGRVLVVERDPSYRNSSTALSNSCMRQQFSSEINVRISQFAARYVTAFREEMGDERVPDIHTHFFGYMYLAGSEDFAAHLQKTVSMQAKLGAGSRIMTPDEIAQAYPFYRTDDILLGAHNLRDEGYFDGGTMFEWWRRLARERGVEFVSGEVVGIEVDAGRARAVRLANGERIGCGWVVNAAGPRAAQVASMAGRALPVEPRKRYTWVFEAERPLDRALPLTIDPTGVHVRSDGGYYMAGATPDHDPAVDPDDFAADHSLWEAKVWPVLAHRIPAFEAIRVVNEWVGHYAYNTLDQNAVVGPDDEVENLLYANGFSGHGLQQAPAMGRGLAEWITTGGWQTLDLSPLGIDRVRRGVRQDEAAII
ncbi:FAD-binding oxidoreductase [Maritimibacter sp. HL-12]|uniref:NAD(P)/FAD-dependent oxidoreductase n=1 Tax=Maritimibacter sp. HL-12 TaxID=1162418 RepID=UPI000A0EEF2E|nr:FAD-binding oxidoreductase [Maritimibacter sp. HL-12]SMH44310.1 Glycine/D-amino acid oxidase [Maritimibacter sp. HL-12]